MRNALAALRRVEAKAASLPRAYRLNAALYALTVLGLGLVTLEVRQADRVSEDVRAFSEPPVATTLARPIPSTTTTTVVATPEHEQVTADPAPAASDDPPVAETEAPVAVSRAAPATDPPPQPAVTVAVRAPVAEAIPVPLLPSFATDDPAPILRLPPAGPVPVQPLAPIVVDPVEPVTPDIPPVRMPPPVVPALPR